jgi:two-component system sensor histidine kinase VicK
MGGGDKKKKYRSKISAKVISYFLIVAIIPVVVVSFILTNQTYNLLTDAANNKQQALAAGASQTVDQYIEHSTNQVKLIASLYILDPAQINQSLQALFLQSPSLQKLELRTIDGKKQTAIRKDGSVDSTLSRIESDDNMLDLLKSKPTSLAITRDNNNLPLITYSQAIIRQSDGKLIGGITGFFNAAIGLKSLLPGSDAAAYAYVVDDQGNLVYHPDSIFLSTHTDLKTTDAVSNFLNNNLRTAQTASETKVAVLSSIHQTANGWGVIAQQPLSTLYGSIYTYEQSAATLAIGTIGIAILVGLYFSRRITRPIKKLSVGARRLMQNDLTQRIDINTKDELQELADMFNSLGINISELVNNLRTNNDNLSVEQSKLRSIINNVNDGVVAVNSRGEIVSINPPAAKLVNQIPYALKGKLITDVFPWTQDGSPFKLDLIDAGIHNYKDISLAKGELISYLDLMVEVLERRDSDVAAIVTIHDQTASRELNFMKLDFVAIAAHELRTPLTVIAGYLDMLNTEAIRELSVLNLESLQKAIVGTNQLRELINKLLNIARIERGDMEIFIEKLNITQLVSRNVEQHQAVAAQKLQTLVYSTSARGAVYVPADTASIVEVLNNLIGNALKYTPKNGKITVTVFVRDTDVRVEVADNGPGIPDEMRDKLFSKFYRAERSIINGTKGTGLGLFISRTIIDLQRGTIGVEPDRGNGSKFFFTLPIYNADTDDELVAKNISGGIHGWFKKRSHH